MAILKAVFVSRVDSFTRWPAFALLVATGCQGAGSGDVEADLPMPASNPVLFASQTPYHATDGTLTAAFGNHLGSTRAAPRGGDLMILYPDGELRNLTAEAGFGTEADNGIAVREPCVSWDGSRALFSMVIGGTSKGDVGAATWQIYEVTGIGQAESAHVERVANQPEGFDNVSPVYGTDGRILFTTDRPRNGEMRLYPQLDEYEAVETNTGLWSFDPAVPGGDLWMLSHVPSGAFSPKIALDGRVIYVRWDHLQQDQQAHADRHGGAYGSFDYVSEESDDRTGGAVERFPEALSEDETQPGAHGHVFNQFFPWQIHEDGTSEETVNHVGRHEFMGYFDSSKDGLPAHETPQGRTSIVNFLQIREDPHAPGTFYGVDAVESGTHTSGQIVRFDGRIGVNADSMSPEGVTDPKGAEAPEAGATVAEGVEGHYRDPLPLSDGTLIAASTPDPRRESGAGDGPLGNATYRFRLRHVVSREGSAFLTAGAPLTEGIRKTVSYFDAAANTDVSYTGEMWELFPVEVVARAKPAASSFEVPEIERTIIDEAMQLSGGYEALRAYLEDGSFALVISRNVTRRGDEQQPYDLAIPGGAATVSEGGTAEEIQFVQFFQADQVRGYDSHGAGRRAVAREMHDAPDGGEAIEGAYRLGLDGSFAALVPARRAMTWQLVAPDGAPVVRERYWVSFQPGEIRVCPNCHGINQTDVVLGEPVPENPPEALAPLLKAIFQ